MDLRELVAQRNRAYAALFDSFIIERQLYWDDETWTDVERREFNRQAADQVEYWNALIEAQIADSDGNSTLPQRFGGVSGTAQSLDIDAETPIAVVPVDRDHEHLRAVSIRLDSAARNIAVDEALPGRTCDRARARRRPLGCAEIGTQHRLQLAAAERQLLLCSTDPCADSEHHRSDEPHTQQDVTQLCASGFAVRMPINIEPCSFPRPQCSTERQQRQDRQSYVIGVCGRSAKNYSQVREAGDEPHCEQKQQNDVKQQASPMSPQCRRSL